jgi:GT2 family glycosyltransferase
MSKHPSHFTVSIVIPNWNGRHLLEKNLPAVVNAKKFTSNNIKEILVVDDGSVDDSVVFLKKQYPRLIKLIQHTKNRGFAEAVNTGARLAKGDLICLLNTDVFPEKSFLSSAIKHFEDSTVFAVGLHEKSHGPSTGSFKNGYLAHAGAPEKASAAFSLWASGGSAVFSRSIWWKLGGLDTELFAPFYWEDVDLGYRAWKHGYKILWEPKALVTHEHEGSINTKSFHKKYMDLIKERNELLFIWKNITSDVLWKKHKAAVVNRIRRHPGYARVVFMSYQKRKLVMKKRLKEQRESTVSDEAVFSHFQ